MCGRRFVALGCGVVLTGAGQALGQASLRAIALSGQPAPGISNRTMSVFSAPVVGSTGQIWYTASLAGSGQGPTSALYRSEAGPLAGPPGPVYTNAAAVPGLGANWVWTGTWSLAAAGTAGELVFTGGVLRTDLATSYTGLFVTDGFGNTQLAAADGTAAPGWTLPFSSFNYIGAATGGRVATRADVTGGGNNTGLWSTLSGQLGLLAFEGEPAAQLPAGVNWGDFVAGVSPTITPLVNPVVNSAGIVAFKAPLAGGVTATTNEGLWYGQPGALALLAREGDPVVAGGAPAGAAWLLLDAPSINARGQIAFAAVLTGGGTLSSDDEAVFFGAPMGGGFALTMLIRENAAAPGLQGLALHERDSLLRTFRNVVINNAGQVAFLTGIASAAGISNSNDGLAYLWTPGAVPLPGTWTLVAREGEAAAGAAVGDVYGNFLEIGISPSGDVAFANALNNANRALFAGPLGQHGLIARRGGALQVGPGDTRTIGTAASDFNFSIVTGGSDGRPSGLSQAGTVVFRARFTNSTEGVFQAALRPVIQPAGDRDADGLRDDWETAGVDINEDGILDLDLPGLGANPDRKDLFVEIDVQAGVGMSQDTIDRVTAAFADAPVPNPAGPTGISLHLLISDTFPGPGGLWMLRPDRWPADYPGTKAAWYGSADDRASPNAAWRKEARRRTMRYAMVIDQTQPAFYYGKAEVDGDDMVFVFGDPDMADDDDRAGTFMHELGHTLGLRHGGADDINFKPNYPSIMNYTMVGRYPFDQLFWRLDYCREALPTLNENSLDENVGFGSATSLYADVYMPHGFWRRAYRKMKSVRLNGTPADLSGPGGCCLDGRFTSPVMQDLTFLAEDCPVPGSNQPSPGEVLVSQNDWERLQLRLLNSGRYAENALVDPGLEEPSPALTAWMIANIPPPGATCAADFDGNWSVEPADVSLFVSTWFASLVNGTLDGDLDGNGLVEPADVSQFVAVWFDAVTGGC